MNFKQLFITGIGTGVGKTVASAIFCEALGADYWKPIQAGDLANTDSMTVRDLISNSRSEIFEERYKLQTASAPNFAAAKENIAIQKSDFVIPQTENKLIIEGAGGILVPINSDYSFLDFVSTHLLPVVIVVKPYLGSINHTLLTVEALRSRKIEIAGLVFNGENEETENFIAAKTGLKVVLRIPEAQKLSKEFVRMQAQRLEL